ncbi:unnamed protein product [Mesocestoides corti]|uniref:VPS10 domain-containing protein n=1 Tax=Mesocestoides corti TaxID=53468 RepID=A0A158QUA2_MESCO|nr:unnamed protein product [Mesocestoides corti]
MDKHTRVNYALLFRLWIKTLFVSEDGGLIWKTAQHDVQEYFWSGFTVDSKNTIYALHGASTKTNANRNAFTLSKSVDGGETWTQILSDVRKIWAPEALRSDVDIDEDGTNSQYEPSGRFLYASHFIDKEKGTLRLSVSDDGGNNFRQVYLPTVFSDRFFSVLEIERDCVFLHVDEPGDTGHGVLYVSDSTGTVFTESLRRHFYPNNAPVTDFYRVSSMPGTFLATQLNPDTTLRTVITHDRGATWHALPVPEGLACESPPPRANMAERQARSVNPVPAERLKATNAINSNATKETLAAVCGLQVSNQFSLRNRVVASPPLATSTARGLIAVHGHVATHLKTTPADVFISTDGGYTWHKPAQITTHSQPALSFNAGAEGLDGPHHYQIANRGGLIVAVPADTLWVDILRFSTDGGRCWHNIPLTPSTKHHSSYFTSKSSPSLTTTATPSTVTSTFASQQETLLSSSAMSMEDETVVFTGLVTEPGGRAMTVAVYGYGTLSQRWRVAVVDFANNGFITKNCSIDDYELWYPHQTDAGSGHANDGCLLGVKEVSYRLKEDSLCFSNVEFRIPQSYEICACTELDYECEYGYWREFGGGGKCVVNPHAPPLDICDLVGQEVSDHLMEMVGYRRIPGDRCEGGWQPPLSNQSFEDRTLHCPPKRKAFGLPAQVITIVVALLIFVTCLGAVIWSRCRHKCQNLHHRSHFRGIFQRCVHNSRLTPQNGLKSNPLFQNTVFFSNEDIDTTKEIPSNFTMPKVAFSVPQHLVHSNVVSAVAHAVNQCGIGGGKGSEDRLDLLENEEGLGEEEEEAPSTNPANTNLANNQQGSMGDLLY